MKKVINECADTISIDLLCDSDIIGVEFGGRLRAQLIRVEPFKYIIATIGTNNAFHSKTDGETIKDVLKKAKGVDSIYVFKDREEFLNWVVA